MKKINYKSDFDFILRLKTANGVEVGWPDYDWSAKFYTTQKVNAFTASCIGGVAVNCSNDGGLIHVVMNNHRLSAGVLQVEFTAEIPDSDYPDNSERIVIPLPLDIELIREAAPCPKEFEVEVLLPYIKGDPFRYEDFTQDQIEDLKRPAKEAAEELKIFEDNITEAENKREVAERLRVSNENERIEAEKTRKESELRRVEAESKRASAESERQRAEEARGSAESNRVTAENVRSTNENERITAETRRVSDESLRAEAETTRQDNETTRQDDESLRQTSESGRVSAENRRVDNEDIRTTNEQGRVSAEELRVSEENKRKEAETLRRTAEEERVKAENERVEEFRGFKETLDNKADVSQLSNVLAVDPMEPWERPDTPEYRRLFIDLWNAACGTFGGYNAETGFFELNGLTDITYKQAVDIYTCTIGARETNQLAAAFERTNIRTNLPFVSQTKNEIGYNLESAFRNSQMEVINLREMHGGIQPCRIISHCAWIFQSSMLHKIIGPIEIAGLNPHYNGISANVEEIQIKKLSKSLNIREAKSLSLESFRYMIDNAANTTAITITVHPEVYAKIMDETNTEWHQLVADAAIKNIQFATV